MKQNLKIVLLYLVIAGLAFGLLRFFPLNFDPQWFSRVDEDQVLGQEEDSIMLSLMLKPDTVAAVSADTVACVWPVDTVYVEGHLSCPSRFLLQLAQLRQRLAQARSGQQVVRILHYGDSQIEGDRITAYLREGFQKRYGGNGAGLNCILDPQHINSSIWLEGGEAWGLRTVYDRHRELSQNSYGLMGRYALLPAGRQGRLKIARSPWAEEHAENYQNIRLFIAPHSDSLFIRGSIAGSEVIFDTLPASRNLTEINWTFTEPCPELHLTFDSKGEIAVLGCALDSVGGVAVDNIALRGQSTPLLQRTDGGLFKVMGEHLGVGMVLLQFGTNMIPLEAEDYGFYKTIMARQFDLLSRYIPDVPVLCIGIADAARGDKGEVIPYRHLNALRRAQREVALQYGYAYFDMAGAMGGEGQMIKWARRVPPLAMSDYIHFTRKGGERAAELILQALWEQFDQLEGISNGEAFNSRIH